VIASLLTGLLLALGALLALLLLAPFHLRAEGAVGEDGAAGALQVRWGPGLAAVRLSSTAGLEAWIFGLPLPGLGAAMRRLRRRKPSPRKEPRPAKKQPRTPKERAPRRALLGHRRSLATMAARLARPLRLRARISGRLGTGDPADTAALAGLCRAVERLPGVELRLELDWIDEVVELEGALSARIWIVHLLGAALSLLPSREHRAALRAAMG
jgi:hypothetical protein